MIKPTALALLAGCAAGFLFASDEALAQLGSDNPLLDNPVIEVQGHKFYSWEEYTQSPLFRELNLRCGFPGTELQANLPPEKAASDCAYGSTSPKPQFNPTFIFDIPVVVHVIKNTSGQGNVTPTLINSQIAVLNEDFRALAGSLGAPGFDCMIKFHLATVDPNGNPTSGYTVDTNNTWFNDGGSYWNTLAWDTNRYLNFYTNSAGGYLGYVPDLPQGGIVGSNSDRVVVLWSAFGRNAPIGPPYNKGRTATHEVGHYLGLWHTFDGGCGTTSCYTTGDRICDTNREQNPIFGCPGSSTTCSSSDPYHNYMDYSDDTCMWEFTNEQSNRMRCVLTHWRPNLPTSITCNTSYGAGCAGSGGKVPLLTVTGCAEANADLSLGISNGLGGVAAFIFLGSAQSSLALGGGCFLNTFPFAPGSPLGPFVLSGVGAGNGAYTLAGTVPSGTPSGTIYMQAFTMDGGGAKNYANSNGVEVKIQ